MVVTPLVNIHGKVEGGPYRCLCCGSLTLDEQQLRDPSGVSFGWIRGRVTTMLIGLEAVPMAS